MTPEQLRDSSLLELFSLEAEAQTQVLSAGLLALAWVPEREAASRMFSSMA